MVSILIIFSLKNDDHEDFHSDKLEQKRKHNERF
jgi:hypothetical protein